MKAKGQKTSIKYNCESVILTRRASSQSKAGKSSKNSFPLRDFDGEKLGFCWERAAVPGSGGGITLHKDSTG